MSRIVLLALLVCLVPAPATARAPAALAAPAALDVRVDARVELMSVIFRLAGNPEYNQARVPAYAEAADAWFGPHREHSVVGLAAHLRRTRGVSYDAVMSMAIHVRDVETLAELVPFDAPDCSLESRWTVDDGRRFLAAARDFVTVSDFAGFIAAHQELYAQSEMRMRAMLAEHADLAWFEEYFGAAPGAEFTVALGLLNGGANYGPKLVHPDGREQLYAVMGVWLLDGEGRPDFDRSVLPTLVHEFSHSFVNHLVLAHAEALRPAGEAMYPQVEAIMRRQAYGSWQTMLCESLVRAAVVRYMGQHDGADAAVRQITYEQEQCGFLWTGALAGRLEEYERAKEQGRVESLAASMPEVVAFFNATAETLAATIAEREQRAATHQPELVSMTPTNGARDVDPATDRIVITFDRAMGSGYSLMLAAEGRSVFPEVLGIGFDETRTVCTVSVALRPGATYVFSLNGPQGGNFRSAEGVPLEMVPVRFSTRP